MNAAPNASSSGTNNPREVVTDEMLTAAMRAFELMSSVLRYREKDKWHSCDMIGMRDAIRAALEVRGVAQAPAWQLIETYDPAHELNVLVSDNGVVSEAYYDGESDSWFKDGKSEHDFDFVSSDRLFPTHWMPMPAAPSVSSTQNAGRPMVPWELNCKRSVCAAPECDCPAVTSTDREGGK